MDWRRAEYMRGTIAILANNAKLLRIRVPFDRDSTPRRAGVLGPSPCSEPSAGSPPRCRTGRLSTERRIHITARIRPLFSGHLTFLMFSTRPRRIARNVKMLSVHVSLSSTRYVPAHRSAALCRSVPPHVGLPRSSERLAKSVRGVEARASGESHRLPGPRRAPSRVRFSSLFPCRG